MKNTKQAIAGILVLGATCLGSNGYASEVNLYDELSKINQEVNKIKYARDVDVYGMTEYWATPEEFRKNGGDCEDFVIAKYDLVKSLVGVDDVEIKIINGMLHSTNQGHVVLRVGDKILDNRFNEIRGLDSLQDFLFYNQIDPKLLPEIMEYKKQGKVYNLYEKN